MVADTSENPSTLNSLLGPGEVSSDGAGSSSLNHDGLAHDVLHLGLGQGVAETSDSHKIFCFPVLACF